MPKFKFESKGLQNILDEYAALREQTIPDAVVASARLLCVELARRTQPFGSNDVSKKAGENRIKNDVLKIVKYPVRVDEMISKVENERIRDRLRALYSSQRWDIISRIFSNIGYLKKWGGFESVRGMTQIQSIHKKNRNQRTGRTFSRADKLYIANSNDLDKHIEEVQRRVGLAKSAWASCAKRLRKVTTGSATRGIPSWVTRHDSPHSDVIDNSRDLSNPRVTLINTTKYISQILPSSEANNAKSIVVGKMISQMKNILKKRNKSISELES